ncbi:MAG TPA: hypothetical protein VD772_03095, partial [Anseongella sp.]|nr:hypothetical protein [Anseongella sp.]
YLLLFLQAKSIATKVGGARGVAAKNGKAGKAGKGAASGKGARGSKKGAKRGRSGSEAPPQMRTELGVGE